MPEPRGRKPGSIKRHHLVMIEVNKRKDFRGNPVEESQVRTVKWPRKKALGYSTSQEDETFQ